MNYDTEANIVRALGKIVANGHMVKGYKPVYWSVVGASALAEAEVEYQDKESFAIDVKFKVEDEEKFLGAFAKLDPALKMELNQDFKERYHGFE